jgi:hypothetical protein
VFGKKKNRDMSQVSPGDFLRALMDPTLLGLMKTFRNKNILSRDPASSSNIIAFLRVELVLSFYKSRWSKCEDRSHHDKVRISRLDYRFPPRCTLILSMLVPSDRQRMGCQVLDNS